MMEIFQQSKVNFDFFANKPKNSLQKDSNFDNFEPKKMVKPKKCIEKGESLSNRQGNTGKYFSPRKKALEG